MDWMARAMLRHCGRLAAGAHVLLGQRWLGLSEADVVGCVKEVLDGLGFHTWLESPYSGFEDEKENPKADLCAEDILGLGTGAYWWFEVKATFDVDKRLAPNRFREYLKDFEHLSHGARPQDRGTVVWVAFVSTPEPGHRFEEPINWVKTKYPKLDRPGHPWLGTLDLGSLLADEGLARRYVHVVVWDVPPGSASPANDDDQ